MKRKIDVSVSEIEELQYEMVATVPGDESDLELSELQFEDYMRVCNEFYDWQIKIETLLKAK